MIARRCAYCSRIVNPDKVYRRVIGWEHKSPEASRRGGSDIVLRETREEFACHACITALRSGVSVHQEAML